MRYASDHKQQTRGKLLAAASRALRRDGGDGLSVAGVMAEAGLTHGGFYAHFPSRDSLVAAAVETTLAEVGARFRAAVEGKPPARALNDYIDFYVSRRHRDNPADGCVMTALGSEVNRLPEAARAAFATGHARLAGSLAALIDPAVADDRQALGFSMVAEMVGAVTLARATADRDLSDRLLTASRKALKARAGLPPETNP